MFFKKAKSVSPDNVFAFETLNITAAGDTSCYLDIHQQFLRYHCRALR